MNKSVHEQEYECFLLQPMQRDVVIGAFSLKEGVYLKVHSWPAKVPSVGFLPKTTVAPGAF